MERRAPPPTTWSGRSRAWRRSRRCWSASRRSATTATAATESWTSRASPGESFDAEVCVEWEKAAREVEPAGVRLAIVRTGQVMETGGGILGELLSPSSSGSAGRSPAATSGCRGSTSPTRSGSCSGRSTPSSSAASSTAPRRSRSPTRSGRRRSGARSPPRRTADPRRRRGGQIRPRVRQGARAASGCCRGAPRSSATRSSTPRSTGRCGPRRLRPGYSSKRFVPPIAPGRRRPALAIACDDPRHRTCARASEVTRGIPADSRIARVNFRRGRGFEGRDGVVVLGGAPGIRAVGRQVDPSPAVSLGAGSARDLEVARGRPVWPAPPSLPRRAAPPRRR